MTKPVDSGPSSQANTGDSTGSPQQIPPASAPKSTVASKSNGADPTADKTAPLPGRAIEGSGRSGAARDPRGSGIDEANLERSVIRRGFAVQPEIDACKNLKAKNPGKSLLEVMVAANVLTKNQATRLRRDLGEGTTKLDIPGYQLLEKLGKGSMGVVYKAKQTSVDRIVAVKILLDSLANNKEFTSRFQREAMVAAKLSHNNIVNAIDAGQVGGHYYFVMEYVEGVTIKDLLDKGKVFDEKVALEIVLKIADALKHAHQRGLIHRDIKPENIILTQEGGVKLADLGLARPTGDEKWAKSEEGMAIGTPYYISPEQVRGDIDVNIQADIYCLGATFYHMVTGRVPYPGETPTEVMKKHVDKNVILTPPDHLNTRLSSGLGEVVETMMAKERANRYQSPDDLILDLNCLLSGQQPMIASQKVDALASLTEGEDAEASESGSLASESEKEEMAAVVNMRSNVIAVLAILLAISVVTNILMLLPR